MYELRDYQKECVETIQSMQPNGKVLVSLPTGTGKTICFAKVAVKAKGKVLIVVPSTELREQAINKLKAIDENIDVGSVQANTNELNHKIVVATRQSLTHKKSTRIEQMLNLGEFEYVIFDEVHQAVNQVKSIILKLNDTVKVVGFTATPFNKDLKDIFTEVTINKDILQMINDNYLCIPRAIKIDTGTDLSNVKTVAGEFVQASLESEINTPMRNKMVVEAWKKYATNRKHTIVFCSGIDHANAIMDAFKDEGIKCNTINSKNDKDDRKEILDSFQSGDFPIITNVNVLTTGFDFEALDCILLASPTKSKTKYVQEIGRGLRLFPLKEDCLIIDMQDTCMRHDIMSLDDIFNVTIRSGESVKEAIKRNDKEAEEELERQRVREELALQREKELQELRAKEIELFNLNMENTFAENSYFDWWKCDRDTFILSVSSDKHYVIQRDNTEFNIYVVVTKKNNNSIELIFTTDSLMDAITHVEDELNLETTTFMLRHCKWKREDATDKQKEAIKYEVVETKWEAHRYFTKWKVKQTFKLL